MYMNLGLVMVGLVYYFTFPWLFVLMIVPCLYKGW